MRIRSENLVVYISVTVILLFVFVGMYLFHLKLDSEIHKTNYSFMQEAANQQVISFRAKLDGQFDQLSLYARNFENIDMNDYGAVKDALNVTRGFGEFKRISIANDKGVVTNNDNTASENIVAEDYFKSAIEGKAGISSKIITDRDGDDTLIISAPIYKDNEIVGVILGTFKRDVLSELFNQELFGGMGYSYVFNSDGEIIIQNNPEMSYITSKNNFFEALSKINFKNKVSLNDVENDIRNFKTDTIEYSIEDNKRIAVYKPIGTRDWYLFSVVDVDYVSAQSRAITGYVLTLIVSIAVFISILVCIILKTLATNNRIMLKNIALERSSEKYKIANIQMKNIIFEYRFDGNILYATGCVDAIFDTTDDEVSLKLDDKLSKKLLRKGISIFDDIVYGRNIGKEYDREINIQVRSGELRWFKLKASYIFDEEKEPIKVVGVLTDIHDQKQEEETLRKMSEIDQLTGLLNKKCFEKYIKDTLLSTTDRSIFAIFIISLDNFKEVTESLGYAFGDEVLIDISWKMKRVFRDSDYLGRFGEDEFIAFLNYGNGKIEDAVEVIKARAERLCTDFRETYSEKNEEHNISTSIGISIFPRDADNYFALCEKANEALYKIKNSGKDNYMIYESQ